MVRRESRKPDVRLILGAATALSVLLATGGWSFGVEAAATCCDGCTGEWSPPTLELSRAHGPGIEVADGAGELLLRIANRRPADGQVLLTVTVFCEHDFFTLERVVAVPVLAESETTAAVPLSRLRLPEAPFRFSGHLSIMARAEYSDGTDAALERSLSLFFHPVSFGWLVYDRASLMDEFDGGALRPEDREAARNVIAGGGSVGPALVRVGGERRPQADGREGLPEGVMPAAPEESDEDRDSLRFCIDQVSTYTDAGVGEDYWTNSTPTARASRGTYARVKRSGVYIWSGNLSANPADLGCTPALDPVSGLYEHEITLFSMSSVQGNDLWVVDKNNIGVVRSHYVNVDISTNVTHNLTIDAAAVWDEFNVAMAGSYALYRHAGGMSGRHYEYRINHTSSYYNRTANAIYLQTNRHNRKFIIVHEFGHAIGDYGTGDHDFKTCHTRCSCYACDGCPSTAGSHTMISKELARCAMAEGWAHFYAADIFNDHDEVDCYFHYYKNLFGDPTPIVNCEIGGGDFSLRFMESNCPEPWGGFGTELDWMRTFWDVHTDGTTHPTFTQMVQWLDAAEYWYDFLPYDKLDAAANAIGGSLNSNWDNAKSLNGIDWSGAALVMIDSFECDDSAWTLPPP